MNPIWSHLEQSLRSYETDLREVVSVLQRERECAVLFDTQGLFAAVQRKQNLLQRLVEQSGERNGLLRDCWAFLPGTLGRDPVPENVAEVVRHLAAAFPSQYQELLDCASRLDALSDVIKELQELNQQLIQQALSWIAQHLVELTKPDVPTGYDHQGRLRERASGEVRGTA